ncbi:MAG: extracellular solute-binding protein, partial [Treponema sp.]|nr:extracellular solute-binding protein [Treponema sp.]
ILVLACVTSVLLVSCQKKEAGTSGAQASPGEPSGKIIAWLDIDDYAAKVIGEFNKLYPNVEVEYQNIDYNNSIQKLTVDGPAGVGGDVIISAHNGLITGILSGALMPFPDELAAKYKEVMLEAALTTCTYEGKLYAAPITTETVAFFYNKDLIGDTPLPQSFEDIKKFCETYNDPKQNKYGFRWQIDGYVSYFFLTAFGMRNFGPNHDDYRTPGWETPEAAKGLEYFLSMRKYFDVPSADIVWDSTVSAFQRGEVPFTVTGPWAIAEAKNNNINFGITKLPTINGVQPVTYGGVITVVFGKDLLST